jgi:RNA polymerase sigma factor (sigma-70 family)
MSRDGTLLQNYQREGCERAFEALVRQHLNLVYSAALRQAGSRPDLVEDIVQKVFIDFAGEAQRFSGSVQIGGWLHRHTCFVASSVLRADRRRRDREQKAFEMSDLQENGSAWQQIEPHLDSAIDSLAEKERLAIVLRFFQKHDLSKVGEALGISEDAAQKRVSRALEKLRTILVRRGTAISVGTLASGLLAHSTVAAPTLVASTVTAAVLGSGALAGAAGFAAPAALSLSIMAKAKIALVSTGIVASLGTAVLIHQTSIAPLQRENAALRAQQISPPADQPTQPIVTTAAESNKLSNEQFLELMRLRGQVTQLRSATNEAHQLAEENRRLRAAANQPAAKQSPSQTLVGQYLAIDSWQYAGLAQPDAAFQSSVWAMLKGDLNTVAASWTDRYLEQRLAQWKDKSDEEIKASLARDFWTVRGFEVNRVTPTSETESIVEITLAAEGEPPLHRARMKKVGNDWRFDGWVKN